MTSHDDALQRARHEARALLLPTPFASTESSNEPRRQETILAWLGLQKGDHVELHDRCASDAQGVHVPGGGTGPAAGMLVHPLSDEKLGEQAPSSSDWDAWVEGTKAKIPFEHVADLEKLWAELHESGSDRDMPGDAILRDHTWLAHRTTAAALLNARWDGGEAALLFVHYGPVQSFIEAARRTSDLWIGSYLVSDLAFVAVRKVAEQCGPHAVVYPHLASLTRYGVAAKKGTVDDDTLQECLRPCVPNRFVAIVPRGRAQALAKDLAVAVSDRWRSMANKVRTWLGADGGFEGFEGFDTQIAEHPVVDVVAQRWPSEIPALESMLTDARRNPTVEYENVGHGYADVFALGRSTLGALRMVIPASGLSKGDARDKCTQCGLREAMGPIPEKSGGRRSDQREWWSDIRKKVDRLRTRKTDDPSGRPDKETLDLRRSEMLCAVCLTKRFALRCSIADEFGRDWCKREERVEFRFPSVASIACAPFRRRLAEDPLNEDVKAWHEAVEKAHDSLPFSLPGNQVRGLGKLGSAEPLLNPDGTWLYARSYDLDTCLRDHDDPDQSPELAAWLREGRKALAKMSGGRKPSAYYAIVMLDVDDMGAWLDGSHEKFPKFGDKKKRPVSASLHADVSRRQGVLATRRLHEVIETHLGQLVYSGGDDVLAFLPLHTLWACLAALHTQFTQPCALGENVTLSAGVAVADWKDPLQGVLKRAREAERSAKRKPESGGEAKDAVVVCLSTRSGMPMSVRLKWDDLEELQTSVNELWKQANASRVKTETEADGESGVREREPELLRPAALEALRAEAPMLQSLDCKDPLRHRVSQVLGAVSFAPLQRMLQDEDNKTMNRILDLLALVRFLVREHGGIFYAHVREETKP